MSIRSLRVVFSLGWFSLCFGASVASADVVSMTNWASYSLTIGASTTAPTKPTTRTESAYWRRVGDTMEINYLIRYSSTSGGADGSGTYLFSLPSGYSIDTSKNQVNSDYFLASTVGVGALVGTEGALCSVWPYDSTHLALKCTNSVFGGPMLVASSGFYMTGVSGYRFMARVPINGWATRDTSKQLVLGESIFESFPHNLGLRDAASITPWASYSVFHAIDGTGPLFTYPTLATTHTLGTSWRRVGDSMEVRYTYAHTDNSGAAAGTGTYRFDLPAESAIVGTPVTFTSSSDGSTDDGAILGPAMVYSSALAGFPAIGYVWMNSAGYVSVSCYDGSAGFHILADGDITASSFSVEFQGTFPNSGWTTAH